MAMSKDREPGSRVSAVLARLGRRARKARWQLAAGVAAVVIVLIAGHAPVWAGVAALLLVMLAALAGPPGPRLIRPTRKPSARRNCRLLPPPNWPTPCPIR